MTTKEKQKPNRSAGRAVRLTALLLAMLLAVTLLAGCAREEAPEEVPDGVVRIGLLEPFTGSDAEGAAAEIRGIELAYMLRSRIGDVTVELVRADNESSLKKTVTAAETLVRKGCVAVLGSYGNMLTLASSNTFAEATVPLVNVTGTNPLLTGSSRYLFRTATVETDQASAAAAYLTETLGLSGVAILLPLNDDYATSMAEEFTTRAGTSCEIVGYVSGTTDFSTQLAVLRSCNVEAVYLPGEADDAAAFLKAARAANAKWKYFGTQRLKTDGFLAAAGLAAEGVYTTGDWDPLVEYTEASALFLRLYRLRYGEEAVPTEAEALGYEAYMLVLDALERAGEMTGPSIRTALSRTEDFDGVTGVATMDREGDLNRAQTVWMVAESAFVNPLTYAPSTVAPTELPDDEE